MQEQMGTLIDDFWFCRAVSIYFFPRRIFHFYSVESYLPFCLRKKKKNSLCFLLLLILLVTKCGFRNLRFDDLLECLAELREILTYNLLVYYNRYYKGYR